MSIPAIMGAAVLDIADFGKDGMTSSDLGCYIAGALVAAVVGYICIKTMLVIVRNKKFYKEGYLLLYSAEFLFLCIHSFFEGYLYTPGYNLCFFFWLILGVIISKNEMLRRRNLVLIKNQHQ